MVACAMLAAFFVLRADLERRGLAAPGKQPAGSKDEGRDDTSAKTRGENAQKNAKPASRTASAEAELLIAIPCMAGLAGAKLYHVLESPADFLAHPVALLFSPFGFAWFGGLLAGFAAFVWVGRRQRIPLLTLLDAGSPAAALGYGIGRIGCFLSGDGDYGVPTSLPWGMSFPNGLVPTTERVHPTPIYELLVACAIAWFLWRMYDRRRSAAGKTIAPPGTIFAVYLVLTGLARFLVEFIRINPRSFLGMSNAQTASIVSIIVGIALWRWLAKRRERSSIP
jgi:phosphatidylglycerol:prolipoprotein diacylglycerol transferase